MPKHAGFILKYTWIRSSDVIRLQESIFSVCSVFSNQEMQSEETVNEKDEQTPDKSVSRSNGWIHRVGASLSNPFNPYRRARSVPNGLGFQVDLTILNEVSIV